jgi:hypothetical protein
MKTPTKELTAMDVVHSWEKAMRCAFQAVKRIPDEQLMAMRKEQHEKAEAEVHSNLALS